MGDFCVRRVRLPRAVRAVTLPNEDATYDIYINQDIPDEWQQQALVHELEHIRLSHFYDDRPVGVNERAAEAAVNR